MQDPAPRRDSGDTAAAAALSSLRVGLALAGLTLAGLTLAGLAACSRDDSSRGPPPPTTTVEYDLVAEAMRADATGPDGRPRRPDLRIDDTDTRDGMAFIRCPAGQSIRWPPLGVRGPARLQYTCGSSVAPLGSLDPRAVRFRVEAARVAEPARAPAEEDFHVVAERTLSLDQLHAAPGPPRDVVELPGEGEGAWVLRFSVASVSPAAAGAGAESEAAEPAGPAPDRDPDWPAIVSPTLQAGAPSRPPNGGPVVLTDVTLDLRSELPRAEIVAQAPEGGLAAGALDPTDGKGTLGGRRPVLTAHAPSRVRYTITPSAGDELRFAVGVDAVRGWQQGGGGMTFSVVLDGQRTWQRTLDPHALKRDRTWFPGAVALAPWAGRAVSLELVTEAVGESRWEAGGWAEPAIVRPRAVPRLAAAEAPTIVLIVVDTLRADRLGCYGNASGLTPRLDRLAAGGIVFRAAHSTSSWTWPATASILTGLPPAAHGVHDARRCLLAADLDTLAELAQRRGYTTAAFVANLLIADDNGFQQGFETFVLTPNATARALRDRVRPWLAATDGFARMLYVHAIDPHHPYAPPAAFRPQAEDSDGLLAELERQVAAGQTPDPATVKRFGEASLALYDGEVRYEDTAIGELLDALAEHGALDDAVVVVTADHGEEFLEHGQIGHGPTLYEETLAVPLIIAGFGRRALPPDVRHDVVSTRDIVPTLVSLAGLPSPGRPLPGASLLAARPAVAPGSLVGPPLFAETFLGRDAPQDACVPRFAMLADGWKLIDTPARRRLELYDLRADPGELHDLAEQQPDRLKSMQAALESVSATAAHDPDVSSQDVEEALRRMQELGYVGH